MWCVLINNPTKLCVPALPRASRPFSNPPDCILRCEPTEVLRLASAVADGPRPDAGPVAAHERAHVGEAAAHAADPADAAGRLDEEQTALLPGGEAAVARAGRRHVRDTVTRHVHGSRHDRVRRGRGARRAHAAGQPGSTAAHAERREHRCTVCALHVLPVHCMCTTCALHVHCTCSTCTCTCAQQGPRRP